MCLNVEIPLFISGDIIKHKNGVSPQPALTVHVYLYAAEVGRV